MCKLIYKRGDATKPQKVNETSHVFIPHCCNDLGGWGAGFVLALSRKWKEPEKSYRNKNEYILGDVDFVYVGDEITVVNMIGQHGVRTQLNKQPIRYKAIETALTSLKAEIVSGKYKEAEIHAPKFGSDLAGGNWDIIEKIIMSVFEDVDINIVIYEYVAC